VPHRLCEQCNELRVNYQNAALAYTRAVRQISGAAGDDLKRILEKAEALHDACRVRAKQLRSHLQSSHSL